MLRGDFLVYLVFPALKCFYIVSVAGSVFHLAKKISLALHLSWSVRGDFLVCLVFLALKCFYIVSVADSVFHLAKKYLLLFI